jgi:succinoglycan biosynthesis transport protein ExoP
MSLSQIWAVLRARMRFILTILLIAVICALLFSLLWPKTYKATTNLVLNYKSVDPASGLAISPQLMPNYLATQIEIIRSRTVSLKVVDALKLDQHPMFTEEFAAQTGGEGEIRDWIAAQLERHVRVLPSPESSVLEISYKSDDPAFAAELANTFAAQYLQTSAQLNIDPLKKVSAYLSAQIKAVRENLEVAQIRLSDYQQENGLDDFDSRLDVESARLDELSSQLVLVQKQMPDTASHKAAIDSRRAGLNTTSGSRIRALQQRERDLLRALTAQKAKVLELSRARDQLSALAKDVDNAQRAYDEATLRFNQTSLAGHANLPDVSILNRASAPQEPWFPRLPLNMVLSVFLGLLLGIGFVLATELFRRRVRSAADLAQALEAPVLATIKWAGAAHAELKPARSDVLPSLLPGK